MDAFKGLKSRLISLSSCTKLHIIEGVPSLIFVKSNYTIEV